MFEILKTFEKGGVYYAQVAKYFGNYRYEYQFGVSKAGYNTIKRINQLRPFDKLSNANYHYFWDYGCGTTDGFFYLSIQFEQEKNIKTYSVKADKQLGENLRWFLEIEKPSELEHLKI